MKNFKFILILSFGFLSSSCNLDEDPIFLDKTLYDTPQSASAALNGIYQGLTNYNTLERRIFVVDGFSGLFVASRGGDNINTSHNTQILSLKPTYDGDSEAMWGGLYGAIAQTNSAIQSIKVVDSPTTKNELLFSDIAGHAHFVRAWSYFSLVRLFGDIPLWLQLADSENLNKPKSTAKEVYAQVISDAKNAASLLNGASGKGYPKQYAANMLLAKVYMTLATNPDLREGSLSEMDYWQMAYTEAMKVYGNYTLVSNYSSLFTDSNENSTESIFELQISQDAANSQMGRNYTPLNYKASQAFGYLRVHADVYDQHVNTYPEDPRIAGTYISQYANATTGAIIKVYPADPTRANFKVANPYFFKFAEKSTTHSNQYNSQNHIIYRYGELLVMLAEISNELQNGQQLGYVTQLLNRVGKVPHAGYLGSKDNFRDAIMMEYRFELLGEGEDSHNNRRRGFDYFLKNTINKHNNNPGFKATVDLLLSTNKSQVMGLPIPLSEVNTNELIN
ncbi:RagB/SusD family nutrient uptake outer membrane protein [Flavobacterium ovatum]|uniref:RagB/SusD family nutrient uptake outer membrane protein n=1 Tax=Flavobacterium ovatum TaxID=1928857 RepID=UPI00344CF238